MTRISDFIKDKFSFVEIANTSELVLNHKLAIEKLSDQELCEFISLNMKSIDDATPVGAHRKGIWSKGWAGDGIYQSNDQYNNLPYYFFKNKYIRFNNNVYRDNEGFGEYHLLRILQNVKLNIAVDSLDFDSIIEYGCGTGHNINFFKTIYGDRYEYYGADWVESSINNLINNGITAINNSFLVDYFNTQTYKAPKNSFLAVTVASLEQTGDNYKEFINYLISNKNCVGAVHIEPIKELLDRSNLLEDLSYRYMQKRNYLTGFVDFLRSKNIIIIDIDDKSIGSTYIQGYQSIVWTKM